MLVQEDCKNLKLIKKITIEKKITWSSIKNWKGK